MDFLAIFMHGLILAIWNCKIREYFCYSQPKDYDIVISLIIDIQMNW